jgi:Sulfotransferase family
MNRPRPNLFLIGSMKSGTTYLTELLRAHPAVFMCSPKEPCHFVDPEVLRRTWPAMWERGYWRSQDHYLSLFKGAESAAVIGEASTVYSRAPKFRSVPERILEFNSQARFIFIMRDPLERTISHYWHTVRWWRERRPMLSAIRTDPHYTDVSDYARQLNEYLRWVDRGRIYVLTLEQLIADPEEQIRRIYAWLGVDASFQPPQFDPSNVRPDELDQVSGFGLLDRLRRISWYPKVAPYLPGVARRLGSRLAARRVRPAEVAAVEVGKYLRPLQVRQTEALSRLLNRTFPEWKTLYSEAESAVRGGELDAGRALLVTQR